VKHFEFLARENLVAVGVAAHQVRAAVEGNFIQR
jgi:hypothetical protein